MAKRIFISKPANETEALAAFLTDRGDTLIASSFLRFDGIPFDVDLDFDIVFFGSPRAVIFYKSQSSIPPNCLIACVGVTTAAYVRAMGHRVDFVGEQGASITAVAKDFKEYSGTKKVLFPTSDRSLNTVSQLFDEAQKYVVPVYTTIIEPKTIEPCDVYVFTSPSNVEGYFHSNVLPENAVVVAWGESTANALTDQLVDHAKVLTSPSVEALIQIL